MEFLLYVKPSYKLFKDEFILPDKYNTIIILISKIRKLSHKQSM